MRAILSSTIPVTRVAVFAEMAWMERRPELGMLCRVAREQGNRLSVASVQSVLPGLGDAGARNVIRWCTMLGVCDERGGLTALGEDVAISDEAPVPEQGVYELWLAQHPVLGRRVLSALRLGARSGPRFDSIRPMPFEPDRGKVFRSVLGPAERFLVRDLPTNSGQRGCLVGETGARCRLRWTLNFEAEHDEWQLEGLIEAPQGNGRYDLRSIQHEAESDGLDLWQLAGRWGAGPLSRFGRWLPDERRLALSFRSVEDDEQDSFSKNLALDRVDIPGKGSYEGVVLEDVSIGPASADDAQDWAMARLRRRLSARPRYRSRAEVRSLFVGLTEETPLEGFAPTLPSHPELLAALSGEEPESFWSLAAPVDLAPYPIAEEDLDALRIGRPAEAAVDEPPGSVRVPYRGGWSMRRLVDRLLGGVVPRKVLLCDRYVRGAGNLATLELLVGALRDVAPSVRIEVWTGGEHADLGKVHAITGTAPRSYHQVFGRNTPHDRYLLLLPSEGSGFGWHMSNSPLHARADLSGASPESPLRWRDLAATRVSSEELEPALRRWLEGGGR